MRFLHVEEIIPRIPADAQASKRVTHHIAFNLSIELPHFYSIKRRKVAVKQNLDAANRKDSRAYGVNAHWLDNRSCGLRRRMDRNVWHRRGLVRTDISICLFLHCIVRFQS